MRVNGTSYQSIWVDDTTNEVAIIDQTLLPHAFAVRSLRDCADAAEAIRLMRVRGAPLIGVTAAYGVALALRSDASDTALVHARAELAQTRPTAVNLRYALDRMRTKLMPLPEKDRVHGAWQEAARLAREDVAANRAIGEHGLALLRALASERQRPLNVLTHCNAGWLATVDYGTALAPLYLAHDAGIPVHVWVSETRPRNQGLLTAWELAQHGVPHSLIADNAAGHLLARGSVDLVLVGADRVTRYGDVCNKIGTYLKALAAHRHGVPFYAAVPCSTIDWSITDPYGEIPIEERAADEVRNVAGHDARGERTTVALIDETTAVANPAFDITPHDLVRGLITERGIYPASEDGLARLRP